MRANENAGVASLPVDRGRSSLVEPARTVAHVVPEYLPRSATFIHTVISHQRRFRPLVLARCLSHLEEFPVERAVALHGQPPRHRLAARLRARAYGDTDSYQSWIAEECRRASAVLIHAHFGWSGRDAIRAATRAGVPLVTTFYGRDLSDSARARWRDPYTRLFRDGSVFIVEGPAMSDHLKRIGCELDRIRIVPIGIDLELFPFLRRPRTEPLVFVHAARFTEKKGFDVSVRAFAAARSRLGKSELWLVGDGPLLPQIEDLVDSLRLRDAVRFLGMLSHAELRRVALRAHAAVQPSRTAADGDTEGGAPTSLLEFQALGIPVLATRHADIPFVVARADDLVPENDAEALAAKLIEVASESDEDRRSRVDEGRRLIERQHDAVANAELIERIYEDALR